MVTGIGAPFSSFWVCALNALQNSMMLRPRCPGAGPTGGDGLAAPAGTCSLTYPVIFFAILSAPFSGPARCGWRPPLPPTLLLPLPVYGEGVGVRGRRRLAQDCSEAPSPAIRASRRWRPLPAQRGGVN